MYCTIPEVEHLLHGLEISKACGPDKISAQMLKYTVSSIAPSVTKLFNVSICLGRIPDCWKEAMIAPIPKSTSKSSDPGNHRPIFLTCILCKLLKKHIYGLMYEHLYNHHLLSDSQWGFRSGRSTVTALLSVTEEWLSALEHGKEVCAVFFDYRKAFDSVPHLALLKKLENLGFNDHILHWISGYLTSRSQTVVVNGESSLPAPVISGVPQGSVLCLLLLFLEYHRALFSACSCYFWSTTGLCSLPAPVISGVPQGSVLCLLLLFLEYHRALFSACSCYFWSTTGLCSLPAPVISGVPQGSVLCLLLLFLEYHRALFSACSCYFWSTTGLCSQPPSFSDLY